MNLTHIESRPSRKDAKYEFIVECDTKSSGLPGAMSELKDKSSYFQVISRNYKDNMGKI